MRSLRGVLVARPVSVAAALVLGATAVLAGPAPRSFASDSTPSEADVRSAAAAPVSSTAAAGVALSSTAAAGVAPTVVGLGGADALPPVGSAFDGTGPVVGVAATPSGAGYRIATSDGGVGGYGDAPAHGSMVGTRLNRPVVGIASTPSGAGYWLVASDGGIFSFGDAAFYGSTGSMRLNQPVVGMAATPSGHGYWLVAADGGIFSFGDAPFFGSTGSIPLNRPIIGMVPTPTGLGYRLVASDGGVFAFGDAAFLGSDPSQGDVVALATVTGGYVTISRSGKVLTFGTGVEVRDLSADELAAGRPVGATARAGGGVWVVLSSVSARASISEGRQLTSEVRAAALGAAAAVGASATVIDQGTLGLVGVTRGAATVQAVAPGWRIPMSTVVVDAAAAVGAYSPAIGSALAGGDVVLGETTARLRGARAGDTVALLGWNGVVRDARVGYVASDIEGRANELFVTPALADALGFGRPESVLIWAIADRAGLDAELARRLPKDGRALRIRHDWDAPDIDGRLAQSQLKAVLGEFAVRGSGTSIAVDPAWYNANVVRRTLPIIGSITCHRVVAEAAANALTEVEALGLAGSINVADTRRYGGCYYPREIRPAGGTTGGNLSRHTWGMALDINPSTNPMGGTAHIDLRVVEVFRKWGFAWGGGFTLVDGMHFEWVGPRSS